MGFTDPTHLEFIYFLASSLQSRSNLVSSLIWVIGILPKLLFPSLSFPSSITQSYIASDHESIKSVTRLTSPHLLMTCKTLQDLLAVPSLTYLPAVSAAHTFPGTLGSCCSSDFQHTVFLLAQTRVAHGIIFYPGLTFLTMLSLLEIASRPSTSLSRLSPLKCKFCESKDWCLVSHCTPVPRRGLGVEHSQFANKEVKTWFSPYCCCHWWYLFRCQVDCQCYLTSPIFCLENLALGKDKILSVRMPSCELRMAYTAFSLSFVLLWTLPSLSRT